MRSRAAKATAITPSSFALPCMCECVRVCCAYVARHTVIHHSLLWKETERRRRRLSQGTTRLYYNAIDVTLVSCTDGSISFHIIFIWYVASIKLLSPHCQAPSTTQSAHALHLKTYVNGKCSATLSARIVVIWNCGVGNSLILILIRIMSHPLIFLFDFFLRRCFSSIISLQYLFFGFVSFVLFHMMESPISRSVAKIARTKCLLQKQWRQRQLLLLYIGVRARTRSHGMQENKNS